MNVRTLEPQPARITSPARPGRPRAGAVAGAVAVKAFAALFAISLLLAVLGRVARLEALALTGGYGVVFFGIGGAPFQMRAGLDLYARLTGSVLVGFAVLLGVGGLMADVHGLWHPVTAALIVGLPAILLHLIGVRRTRRLPADRGELTEALLTGFADLEPDGSRRSPYAEIGETDEHALSYGHAFPPAFSEADTAAIEPVDAPRPGSARALMARWTLQRFSLHCTLVGTVFWLMTAVWTRDPNPTYWGMLRTIDPLWYVGLAMVLIGFAVGRRSEISGAVAAVSFGLATTLTPALVYGAPREQTSEKQMQLTQYVLAHHHIHVTAGIYQAYSTTFAGIAWLSQLLGINGMLGHMSLWGLATYWPVLLVLMRVAELRFLAGRLLPTSARRWTAVMLVLLVDSLGADYYSPQAIGYVMAIGVVAIAMKGLTPRPFGRLATFCLLTLAGVTLAPTHELSPFMATGALLVLAMFGQAPWWTPLPVGISALAWTGIVHKAVSQNFSFGALFNLGNFRPPVTVSTPGLHRLAVVGTQSHVLLLSLLLLIALGAIGFLPNIRRRWAWAYALCPFVGIAFIAINPYGNEGIFRATLFAIPWMAVLAMRMPHPAKLLRPFRHRGVLTAAVAACLGVLLATFLIAAYAMDGTNVLPRGNVAVTDYLMRQHSHNTFVVSIGSASNPADGAGFDTRYSTLEWSDVAKSPELQTLHPSSVDAIALADRLGLMTSAPGASRSPIYVIWSHSTLMYCNAYGLQSPAQMRGWLRLLETSRTWRLVDRSDGTYLFKLT